MTAPEQAGESTLATDLHVEATYRLTEALVASEKRMRRRVEMLSEAVFETDPQGRLVFLNPAWQTIFGTAPDQALGQLLGAQFVDEDRSAWAALQPVRGQAASPPATLRARRSDGRIAWVEVSTAATEEGGTVGVIRDVSRQKLAQDELARLSIVASSTDNLVVITDAQGRIEWVNRAFIELTGHALAEIIGRKPGELLQGPDTDRAAVARISQALREGRSIREELVNYRRNGSRYWIVLQITPVRDHAGRIERFVSVQADISERKRQEQVLIDQQAALEERVQARTAELARAKAVAEAATQAKSQFLANMSHEIRTPLNAIIGLSYLCLKTALQPQQQDYLSKIEQAGQGLMRIVDDILDFSKIEAGGMQLELVPFSPVQVGSRVISVLSEGARGKGLQLTSGFASDLPPTVLGDPLRLEQVLLNLCGNAIKFTHHGTVELRIERLPSPADAPALAFSVSDTGIGIEPAQLARLFQPFTQADSSTTREYGGTGLGLAISRRLVEGMGGAFDVRSEPGVGSVFRFVVRFRAAGPDDAPAVVPAGADPEVETMRARIMGARLLVVEDNEFNQQVIRELLERAGAQVDVAGTGRQALQCLEGEAAFDAVLMDMQMPDIDGLEVTHRIRRDPRLGGLAVIAMTANATVEDRQRCLAAGMNDFETKPVVPDRLYRTLGRWLPGRPRPAVLDRSRLEAILGRDVGKLAALAQLFLRTSRETLSQMTQTHEEGALAELGRLAHKLKGSASAIGADELAVCCHEIESAGRGNDAARARRAMQRLPPLLRAVEEALAAPQGSD
jgi:two-component system sensor histidine kinase/response regulator